MLQRVWIKKTQNIRKLFKRCKETSEILQMNADTPSHVFFERTSIDAKILNLHGRLNAVRKYQKTFKRIHVPLAMSDHLKINAEREICVQTHGLGRSRLCVPE